jgi:hypothetical protein
VATAAALWYVRNTDTLLDNGRDGWIVSGHGHALRRPVLAPHMYLHCTHTHRGSVPDWAIYLLATYVRALEPGT